MKNRQRLDTLLVERKLADSRSKATAMIMAAEVFVDDRIVDKPGTTVPISSIVRLKEKKRYVSRGGIKLEAALSSFAIDPAGKICADVGASTGGFTDCLLQAKAALVYAIDVGSGILDYRLRQDDRVRVLERTNARYLHSLGELVELAVVDVSFISLRHILPSVLSWLSPNADAIVLVKPQFEAGKSDVGKGGIVKDTAVHKRVIHEISAYATSTGFTVMDIIRSPITGQKGNIEFLMWLRTDPAIDVAADAHAIIVRLFRGIV